MSEKMQILKFSEGMNGHFLPIGLVVMAIGFVCFIFSGALAIAFLVIAICLFTSISRLEFDMKRNKYRVSRTLFFFKIGQLKSFSNETQFCLKLSSENSYNFGGNTSFPFFIPTGGFYNNGKSKSITYDLVITDKFGKNTLIYDFEKYKLAKSALAQLTKHGLQTRDLIVEKLEANRQRRR